MLKCSGEINQKNIEEWTDSDDGFQQYVYKQGFLDKITHKNGSSIQFKYDDGECKEIIMK